MKTPGRILVFHTAYIGDIVLALPLVQVLREHMPDASITVVTTPGSAALFTGHPSVNHVMQYDKRGARNGIRGILAMAADIRKEGFDAALIPHRSLRSAVVCALAKIPIRIGFSTSTGRYLMTQIVPYVGTDHEILRNLALARPFGIKVSKVPLPCLYPSDEDRQHVENLLRGFDGTVQPKRQGVNVAVAPGSIWNTKRWPEEKYLELVRLLTKEGVSVVLVGGDADAPLCSRIAAAAGGDRVFDASGKLSLLQSSALIGRCAALITNDSAPMHLGLAMQTPVIAIYGATSPTYGFAPIGIHDRVVETNGLPCRPCSIHGGKKCPIGTFECMHAISAVRVRNEAMALLGTAKG